MALQETIIEDRPDFRRVEFTDAGGGYELTCDWHLAQAVGAFKGIQFYFRAKHGEWEFETEDEFGHSYPPNDLRNFVRRIRFDASPTNAMSIDWAAQLIGKCLSEIQARFVC